MTVKRVGLQQSCCQAFFVSYFTPTKRLACRSPNFRGVLPLVAHLSMECAVFMHSHDIWNGLARYYLICGRAYPRADNPLTNLDWLGCPIIVFVKSRQLPLRHRSHALNDTWRFSTEETHASTVSTHIRDLAQRDVFLDLLSGF